MALTHTSSSPRAALHKGRARLLLAASAAILLAVPCAKAAETSPLVDVSSGWRYLRASLLADLGGASVDDSTWDEGPLDSSWRVQLAPGYDGVVWYRREVDLAPDARTSVSLFLPPSRYGTYQLWADGAQIAEVGSLARLIPFPQARAIPIPEEATRDGRVQLAIRFYRVGWLSDAAGPAAGPFEGPALMGASDAVNERLELSRLRSQRADLVRFLLALLFVGVGLYHVVLYSRRATDRTYLWFGLGAVAFGTSTLLLTTWVAGPIDHLALTHRLSGIAWHAALVALPLFLWAALGRPIDRWLKPYLIGHGGIMAFLAIAPSQWVWATDPVRVAWMLPALVVGPALLVSAARAGHPDARALLAGAALLVVAELAELARMVGAPLPSWLPVAGFSAVLVATAFMLAERFSRMHAELSVLRIDLEHRLDQRTRAMADLARAGERTHRAKSEFLANMSHELRTPLNTVIGFANVLLLRSTMIPERERDFLTRIRASGEHLLEVVDDVLDLSRIEAGQMEVQLQATHVEEVARAIVTKLEGEAQAKALYLDLRTPRELGAIRVDAARLAQVLQAIVGNAIKFTRHGGVTVVVEAEGGRPRAIVVEDTGIGITPEQIQRIFEPFQQGESGLSRRYSGTGLGLTIARSLCGMMGCELSVQSEPGVGSRFRIALPTLPARPRLPISEDVAEAIEGVEAGRLVLIIDDEADARLLLEEHIRSFGMRAVSAESGLEGLRLARELSPDLVTLDLKMPGMDGWATLRAFKADPALRSVPVVVVSVIAAEARGTFLGQVDLVGKPVDRDALEAAVRRNLKGRPSRVLVVDDDADQRLLLSSLLEDSVEEIRTAADGQQALDLLDEFEPGVILLDLVMPRMDGMTFLRALRENPRYARTPVLVVTGKELTEAETAVLDRVTAGVVRKGPLTAGDAELRDRLATFLDASTSRN